MPNTLALLLFFLLILKTRYKSAHFVNFKREREKNKCIALNKHILQALCNKKMLEKITSMSIHIKSNIYMIITHIHDNNRL